MTVLLRRTICGHLRCSRFRRILDVFQRIRFQFFRACGLARGPHLIRLITKAMSDRLLDAPNEEDGGEDSYSLWNVPGGNRSAGSPQFGNRPFRLFGRSGLHKRQQFLVLLGSSEKLEGYPALAD